jgi:phage anti-repressor protein
MSVDIVNLIENNPITKLNGNYQSKLIEKVKNKFTDYEQQMFLASFFCYLKYDNLNDYVIDLDDIWKWLGFCQKDACKRLLEKNFIIDKDYKKFASTAVKAKKDTCGGHNKEKFLLNIETFKKICLKSCTKKADEIHEYFIKLETILQEIIYEESNELKLQFEQLEDKKNKEYEIKLEQQKYLEREKVLLKEYGSIGCIVYIIKVKSFENGRYIIKIGESRKGISERYKEHKSKYEECLLLDCFKVNKSKNLESFIHNKLKMYKVHDLQNHENELELFLIGKELTYQQVLKLINTNLDNFNGNDINKLELENEQLKLLLEMKHSSNENPLLQELIQSNTQLVNIVKQLSDKIDKLESSVLQKINPIQQKVTTGFNEPLVTLGPRLQKIHPTTFELIKVYESVSELMKENPNIKRPSINKAVLENTVYYEYRWLLVDRELDPNIIRSIEPTRKTQVQNVGYIAQINLSKTEITNVYLDKKQACLLNGYTTSSALDTPVKNFSAAKGYYYKLYNECEDYLRENFENIYCVPLLYKNGLGQYDLENNLVKEFACKYDCIKQLKISDKTLAKALENNTSYNGYYFKELGIKLKIVNDKV